MNKKADVPLLINSILGLLLGALIVIALFAGVYKIYTALSLEKPKESDFNSFKTSLEFALEQNTGTEAGVTLGEFSLTILNPEVIFSINKKISVLPNPNIQIPQDIIKKSKKSSPELISMSLIKRPESCGDSACICNCILEDSEDKIDFNSKEIPCKKETENCLKFSQDIAFISFEDSAAFYFDDQGTLNKINSNDNLFIYTKKLQKLNKPFIFNIRKIGSLLMLDKIP